MIMVLIALLLAGFLVKLSDELIDTIRRPRLAYLPGLAYGAIAAWAVLETPVLAPLAVGIVLAVILTKKIDHGAHAVAVIAFAVPLLARLGKMDWLLLAVFSLAAAADELGNPLADRGKIRGIAYKFFRYRMSLEAAAVAVSAATGSWEFVAAIALFDAGYIIAEKISGKAIVASE